MESSKKFSIKESIKGSWGVFKNHFGILLQALLIILAISITTSILSEVFANNVAIYSLVNILSIILSILTSVAYYFALLSAIDDKKNKLSDIVKSISIMKSVKMFLSSLLVALVVVLPIGLIAGSYAVVDFSYKQISISDTNGKTLNNNNSLSSSNNVIENSIKVSLGSIGVLYVLFAIFLSIKWQYAPLAIVDKDLKIVESLKYSWNLTKNNSGKLLALQFVNLGIVLLGLICLIIGLIPASILVSLIYVYVYRKLQTINNL